jgi:hypothetical protein
MKKILLRSNDLTNQPKKIEKKGISHPKMVNVLGIKALERNNSK